MKREGMKEIAQVLQFILYSIKVPICDESCEESALDSIYFDEESGKLKFSSGYWCD